MATRPVAYVGLGANLGDAAGSVRRAMAEVAAIDGCELLARSSLWCSAPVDASGPDYVNAVVALRTSLEPQALLAALQALEARHGRERPYRNAPRTLDLDLLLHGDERRASAQLELPHPRLHERAFVLRPLAEIAPALVVPGQGAVAELLARVADQRIDKLQAP